MFCIFLASIFGAAGLLLGIAISASIIEMSKPVAPPPPPPPPVEYRERDRMRGRGHEIRRSKGHAERVEQTRSSETERGM